MAKRKKKKDLSLEQAKKLFRYKNGKLFWKIRIRLKHHSVGDRVSNKGCVIPIVMLNGQSYQLHRIVYLLHHGYCPEKIDFKNKTLTAKGSYSISIKNLFEPPKKIIRKKPKKIYKEELSYHEVKTYFKYKNGRLYWKKVIRRCINKPICLIFEKTVVKW